MATVAQDAKQLRLEQIQGSKVNRGKKQEDAFEFIESKLINSALPKS